MKGRRNVYVLKGVAALIFIGERVYLSQRLRKKEGIDSVASGEEGREILHRPTNKTPRKNSSRGGLKVLPRHLL